MKRRRLIGTGENVVCGETTSLLVRVAQEMKKQLNQEAQARGVAASVLIREGLDLILRIPADTYFTAKREAYKDGVLLSRKLLDKLI